MASKLNLKNNQGDTITLEHSNTISSLGSRVIPLDNITHKVSTIAELRAMTERPEFVYVEAYDDSGSTYGAFGSHFFKRSLVVEADNGGTVIQSVNDTYELQYEGAVNVKWFDISTTVKLKAVIESLTDIDLNGEIHTVVTTDLGSSNNHGIMLQSGTSIKNGGFYCTGNIVDGTYSTLPSLFVCKDVEDIYFSNVSFDSSSELDARVTSSEKGVYQYIGIEATSDHSVKNITVDNCSFTKNFGGCVGGLPSSVDGNEYYKDNVVVKGCNFKDVGNHCFGLRKAYKCIVTNNKLDTQLGVQFTGVKVGMFCDFSEGTTLSVCSNNVLNGVQAGIKTESDGYVDNYSQNNMITNNIIDGFTGEGAKYGIQLGGVLDKATNNTIKLGLNPITGLATTEDIIGISINANAYKCIADANNINVNGNSIKFNGDATGTTLNKYYNRANGNTLASTGGINLAVTEQHNAEILNNVITGTSNLISIQGLNVKIKGNRLLTGTASVGAIYFNNPASTAELTNFDISDNEIICEGQAVFYNIEESYSDVIFNNNNIKVSGDVNAVRFDSMQSLVFDGNHIELTAETPHTTTRRCLMLASSVDIATDSIVSNNVLINKSTSNGSCIFGEFKNSVISGNSLTSYGDNISIDDGDYSIISNNSYRSTIGGLVQGEGINTISVNNLAKG